MTTTVTLGSTGITVNKNGFGALPVQRVSKEDGAALLKKAHEAGIPRKEHCDGLVFDVVQMLE